MEASRQEAPWYRTWFGSDYLKIYQHRTAQEAAQTVGWLVHELALKPPGRLLDLACGNGRHSLELARLGFRTFSLDLSWPLLQAGRSSAQGLPVETVRGDMRRLPFASAGFGLVLSLFTSFGYFREEAQDVQVMHEVARVLKPGGCFVLDFLNAARVKDDLNPQEIVHFNGGEAIIERWVEDAENRIEKRITVRGSEGEVTQYRESVSLYGERDLRRLFEQASIIPRRVYGNYDGAPFSKASPRLIIMGIKSA